MNKPGLPQGTRDFDALTIRKRQYIMNIIKKVFENYGFEPLETPAMENLETLMGKYGEEGDKLIFRILNNGLNDAGKAEELRKDFELLLKGSTPKSFAERALKYDLTIPFARYVAMNHGRLNYPYKRYQMQPVWRADRPQRGRYREFWQCDADVVGSRSLLQELEFVWIYYSVFNQLQIPVSIRINHRQILAGLAAACGNADKLTDITIAIDKLDKIGLEKVQAELVQRGLDETAVNLISAYLQIKGKPEEQLEAVKKIVADTAPGQEGLDALTRLLFLLKDSAPLSSIALDFTLARGLNYYTGCIFEIKAEGVSMGSIGGGGRYDDLTGLFGVKDVPGVGISFGIDRIYDVLEELNLFPEDLNTGTKVLFVNLGEAESQRAFQSMQELRTRNIPTELFPDNAKMAKQFKYADRKNIPFVIVIGSEELASESCQIKNMVSGEQVSLPLDQLSAFNFQ